MWRQDDQARLAPTSVDTQGLPSVPVVSPPTILQVPNPHKDLCPMDGAEAASHFLHQWFAGCEGLVELRHGQRTPNGEQLINVRSEWFSLDKLENMARHAIKISAEGRETYFGVTTRKQRRGDKNSVAMIPGLFCDLDFSAFEAGGIDALERLDRFKPQPTAVVHTGGGLHCYWRLKTPLLPTPQTQGMVKALVRELGADPAATDLSRVLRVPGTWSWKRDAPVKLLRCRCA